MIVLDAYALVALLGDEPAADAVSAMLGSGGCRISAINLAEAVYVSTSAHGLEPEDVRDVLVPLILEETLVVDPPGADVAWRAAGLRREHYVKRTSEVSLADCFLLAAARPGDAIATADPAVAKVALSEGVELLGLPDSRGRHPPS